MIAECWSDFAMLAASMASFAQWLPELPCASLWKACAKHMTTMAYCCALSACAWKRRFSNCSTPAPRNSTHKEQHRTFPKPREHASTTRAAHQLHTPLDTLPPRSTTPASHRHATSNTPTHTKTIPKPQKHTNNHTSTHLELTQLPIKLACRL